MRHVRALNQELAIHLDVLQGCLGIDPVELRKDAFDLIHVDESVFVAVFAVHLCRNPAPKPATAMVWRMKLPSFCIS